MRASPVTVTESNTTQLPISEPEPVPLQPDHEIYRLDVLIRTHILFVLNINGGNRRQAAEDLGMARSTLYRMLRDYGVARKHGVSR
jgi:DNA-binding NtrC family response regulator